MLKLFKHSKIGHYGIQCRVVLATLTRLCVSVDNVPTDMTVYEATFVNDHGCSGLQCPGICTREQIEGWKKVADAVHEEDIVFFMPLPPLWPKFMKSKVGFAENKTCFSLEVVDTVMNAIDPERMAIRFSPGRSCQDMHDIDTLVT
ncbi:hypothetical protein G6F56_006716 [Rhizopus delemar]|nr:hypothetical protein G6F56_006716 [Rhizopus delemar]